MSMKVTSTWRGEPTPVLKPMFAMKDGEVCYEIKRERYVMMISGMHGNAILILQDKERHTNSYSPECDHEVRELYQNENIVIKFS